MIYIFCAEMEVGSCYLARYDDRLLFLRILASGWNYIYIQSKGLELQEQTSCHFQVKVGSNIFPKMPEENNCTYFYYRKQPGWMNW